MPTFYYRAINQNGNLVTGDIEAETLANANQALATRGYIPSKVSRKRGLTKGAKAGSSSPNCKDSAPVISSCLRSNSEPCSNPEFPF